MLAHPDYHSCRQGAWADCWLLSALVCLAYKRPGDLLNLVRDLGDGSYEVMFPNRPPVVARPDRGTGTASEPWPWAAVIESAAQELMDTTQPRVTSFGIGIELLTGNNRTGYTNVLGRGFAPVWRAWSRARWFEQRLADATANGRLIVLGGSDGVVTRPKQPWISPQHCHAVLDYDPGSNRVRVRDPRGIDDGQPACPIPPDRKAPGYGPGEFWLTPAEVEASFCGLTVEND